MAPECTVDEPAPKKSKQDSPSAASREAEHAAEAAAARETQSGTHARFDSTEPEAAAAPSRSASPSPKATHIVVVNPHSRTCERDGVPDAEDLVLGVFRSHRAACRFVKAECREACDERYCVIANEQDAPDEEEDTSGDESEEEDTSGDESEEESDEESDEECDEESEEESAEESEEESD